MEVVKQLLTKTVFTTLVFTMASTISLAGPGAKGHHHKESEEHHESDHQHEMSPVGMPAAKSKATKIIKVTADDSMHYTFEPMPELSAGDVVQFVVSNNGNMPHEFSIGDDHEQSEHRAMMRKMPNMVHKDGNTITVAPGATESLTWKFKSGAEVVFSCNIPGHYEAGMFLNAKVSKKMGKMNHDGMEEHEHMHKDKEHSQ